MRLGPDRLSARAARLRAEGVAGRSDAAARGHARKKDCFACGVLWLVGFLFCTYLYLRRAG